MSNEYSKSLRKFYIFKLNHLSLRQIQHTLQTLRIIYNVKNRILLTLQLTFLEFYEIILEATKQLLVKKKLQMKELETEDASSQKNNNLQKIENFTTIKRSSVRKSFKINKNKT